MRPLISSSLVQSPVNWDTLFSRYGDSDLLVIFLSLVGITFLSLHIWSMALSQRLKETLRLLLCILLFSLLPYPTNSSHLSSPGPQYMSPQLSKIMFVLLLVMPQVNRCLHTENGVNCTVNLMCVSFLGDHSFLLLSILCVKTVILYVFFWFYKCFHLDVQLCTSYSILTKVKDHIQ